jgi:cation transport ATPase
VLAALVLVPSVPMLLASAAALLLFYMAPVRFGNLISRLPGESVIRTILVFAPATLLAVVVLALLYAVDQGGSTAVPIKMKEQSLSKPTGEGGFYSPAAVRQTALTLSVIPLIAALLFSLAVWSLSFVSPGRFDRFLEPFPGERYLRALVPIAPWILFALVLALLALITVQRERSRSKRSRRWMQDLLSGAGVWVRWAVSAILMFALPALGISILALGATWLRPERISVWIEKLPFDSLVRLGLLFAPPMLFAVVVLAFLYLEASKKNMSTESQKDLTAGPKEARPLRSVIATGVLMIGLTLTVSLGVGLLGTVAYLILR